MPIKVLGSKKNKAHGDLLHWNFSCSLTFNFLVHQDGGDCFTNFIWVIEISFGCLISSESLESLQNVYSSSELCSCES